MKNGILLAFAPALLALALAGCGGNSDSASNVNRPQALALLAGSPGVSGMANGLGTVARFDTPTNVIGDGNGNLLVADVVNAAIRRITLAGQVSTPNPGSLVPFPVGIIRGMAINGAGNLLVEDKTNIPRCCMYSMTPAGVSSTVPGSDSNTLTSAYAPTSLAVDAGGNVFMLDGLFNVVRKFSPAGDVSIFAGTEGVPPGSADGQGAAASFSFGSGGWVSGAIVIDGGGTLYVADSGNNTIRKISSGGLVSTLAGSAGVAGSADGMGAAARFNAPAALAVDGAGTVYVADANNNTIRKITPAGLVSTIVGVAGTAGFQPGKLPGLITLPLGIAVLPDGGIAFSSGNAVWTAHGF